MALHSLNALAVHSAITRKNLLSWLLLLHLGAITIASGVAIAADCDGDRLRALFLAAGIAGWITAFSTVVFLVLSAIKRRLRIRDVIMLIILLLIGLDESRMATSGWALLMEVTS